MYVNVARIERSAQEQIDVLSSSIIHSDLFNYTNYKYTSLCEQDDIL